MSQADDIRGYVMREYIEPARARGQKIVEVRVGDVNSGMGLESRQPAIAGALGALKFLDIAKVRLLDRTGPQLGGNLIFTFELL